MKKALFLFVFLSIQISFYTQEITDELIVYYNFNGDGNDVSSNGLNATVNGATLISDRNGIPNSAYYFDGTDDFFLLPNVSELKPLLPVTVSFWVKTENLNTQDNTFINTGFEEYKHSGFGVLTNALNTGEVAAYYGDNGGSGPNNRRSKNSATSLTIGVWHHVTCVIRGATDMDIYIDCENAGGTYSGTGGNIVYGSNAGRIGCKAVTSGSPIPWFFNGTLDEVAIWNRALEEEEILLLCDGFTIDDDLVGCTDISACNYNSQANQNDDSCLYAIGCDECDDEGGIIDYPEIGDDCDDGNPNTLYDIIGEDCNCGELVIDIDVTHQEQTNFNVSIYPNPFNHFATVEINRFEESEYSLFVYDLQGKLVFSQMYNSNRIQIQKKDFSAGMYFYKIKNRKNKLLSNGKLSVY